jgi:hypothetical protein
MLHYMCIFALHKLCLHFGKFEILRAVFIKIKMDSLVSMMPNTVILSVKHSKELSSTVSIREGNSLHGVISLQIRILIFLYFVALYVFVLHVCNI